MFRSDACYLNVLCPELKSPINAIAIAIAIARTNVPLSSARTPTSFVHPLYGGNEPLSSFYPTTKGE